MEQQNLWAPWRMEYIRNIDPFLNPGATPASPAAGASAAPGATPRPCFLCDVARLAPGTAEFRRRLVLLHDERGMLLLNLYPYTNGHLLVSPGDHLGDLLDLSPAQRAGLMELTALGEGLLRAAINPQGINIGVNLGRCAGAGVPGHIHVHIVPRWSGDVNFMDAIGHVRVIPQALEESYEYLAAVLEKMRAG